MKRLNITEQDGRKLALSLGGMFSQGSFIGIMTGYAKNYITDWSIEFGLPRSLNRAQIRSVYTYVKDDPDLSVEDVILRVAIPDVKSHQEYRSNDKS